MDRRTFLRAGVMTGGLVAAGPLRALEALAASGGLAIRAGRGNPGYGPLHPAGRELALPWGFRYVRFGAAGEKMSNGHPMPATHDGMHAFPGPKGTIRLVRNHEINGPVGAFGASPYDPKAGGGTVTLIFDPGPGRLLGSHPSLTGTVRNCAGGPTPWGSWISCEETVGGPAQGYSRPHGYCFEVPAAAPGPVAAQPLRAMGRFVHEAVCVDPGSGAVYETEDTHTAGLYRFWPKARGHLAAGGWLQMLAVAGQPHYDTRKGQHPGRGLPVHWVPIDDPDPKSAGTDPSAVFNQGRARGGATFGRLEGCFWHGGRAVIVSTNGGDAGLGQVWEYWPGGGGGGEGWLKLIFESHSPAVMQMPDNVTATPRGGLILCEDGAGPDRLLGFTPDGQVFDFAWNRFSVGEFAGATFSPDGRWLFVNVQDPGATFAITGPWNRGPL